MVGLANSEAELAGVIGHEIGHVTAGHSALRQERATIATGALLGAQILGAVVGLDPNLIKGVTQVGQVAAGGILADYSRGDELAADNLGIRYLARSGYDPYAQADFLESMGASSSLDARMAGKSYNPNATNFLASHPANGPRTRRAIEVAQKLRRGDPVGAGRNRDRFLQLVDGITYGDSAEQGFVRGRNFAHPKLRFSYDSPARIHDREFGCRGDGERALECTVRAGWRAQSAGRAGQLHLAGLGSCDWHAVPDGAADGRAEQAHQRA